MTTLSNDKDLKNRLQYNFRASGLTEDQFLQSCKQYLYAKRKYLDFKMLSASEQVAFLEEHNVLDRRFLGDRGLVEILKDFDGITLTKVASMIFNTQNRLISDYSKNIDFSDLLKDKNDILIVNAEKILDKLPEICSLDKKITLWTTDSSLQELLFFDYEACRNINVRVVNIYDERLEGLGKYKYVLCFPEIASKRRFERGKFYGNDCSTVAGELLFKNQLENDGVLSIIMSKRINSSQMEAHFRQEYETHLIEVVELEHPQYMRVGLCMYKFSKQYNHGTFTLNLLDKSAEVLNIDKIINLDSTWDFEKPFKKEDEIMLKIKNKGFEELKNLAEVLRGKPLPKYAEPVVAEENFTYIDMRSIKDDGIDFSEAKKYKVNKDLSSDYLKDGDLLIINKGTNTSRVVLYKHEGKNCIASANLIVIRPASNQINSEYLLMYLRSKIGQKLLKDLQRGSAMPSINHCDLKAIAVIVPQLSEQKELVANYILKIENYKKQLETIKNEIAKLEQDLSDVILGDKKDFT